MAENRFVLDTNAVIFLTTEGNTVPQELQEALNGADLFISVISEIELFAKPLVSAEEENSLRAFLADCITVEGLTDSIKQETIAIRRASPLKR